MTQAMTAALHKHDDARSLQAALYREIGISAVAAALRFTTQPEPAAAPRPFEISVEPRRAETIPAKTTLAA